MSSKKNVKSWQLFEITLRGHCSKCLLKKITYKNLCIPLSLIRTSANMWRNCYKKRNKSKYKRKHMSILGTGVITEFWHHPLGHAHFTSTAKFTFTIQNLFDTKKCLINCWILLLIWRFTYIQYIRKSLWEMCCARWFLFGLFFVIKGLNQSLSESVILSWFFCVVLLVSIIYEISLSWVALATQVSKVAIIFWSAFTLNVFEGCISSSF